MIKVKSYEELSKITDCEDGESGYVELQDNKYKPFVYKKSKNEWVPKTGKTGINLTNYDLNKQQISKLPDYDWETKTEEAKNKISDFISHYEDSKYYMFLCSDIRYYTLFHKTSGDELKTMEEEMVNILKDNFKTVRSIDVYQLESTKTWVCEIWFALNEEVHVSYLFPYDGGVIECL